MFGEFGIFVIDNDASLLEKVRTTLAGVCSCETFPSAADCMARVAEAKPELFLIGNDLPGGTAYSLCEGLKQDFDTQDIPVLFLSPQDDSETRMRCYEAGGDDLILKPFDAPDLLGKLKVAARIHAEKTALRDQAGFAQRTAMSAMVSMSELGIVLQFLSKSFSCANSDELARAIIEAMTQYDLDAAVQLRMGDEVLSFSHNGHNVPLEISVLNHVRNSGRIFQFKSRCVFNYEGVTLMVNNMPLADGERCGRIRDNGAILAEGAAARLRAIEADLLAQRRRDGIEAALPRLYGTLDGVQANYRRNCFELTQVMIDFQEALTKSFIHLGLTEQQEEFMSNMANEFMLRVVGTQDSALSIVGQLEALAEDLKLLLKN